MSGENENLVQLIQAAESRLSELTERLDALEARAAISEAIFRFSRGLDRLDRTLMMTAFHADAHVDYGNLFTGSVGDFIDFTMEFQREDIPVQHLVGNILIELLDDHTAVAESYELARHPAKPGAEGDMILATRLLDRFQRRDGRWRITSRIKVGDWARIHEGSDPVFQNIPLKRAKRNRDDPSYGLFTD